MEAYLGKPGFAPLLSENPKNAGESGEFIGRHMAPARGQGSDVGPSLFVLSTLDPCRIVTSPAFPTNTKIR